jgi:hypothetical protein
MCTTKAVNLIPKSRCFSSVSLEKATNDSCGLENAFAPESKETVRSTRSVAERFALLNSVVCPGTYITRVVGRLARGVAIVCRESAVSTLSIALVSFSLLNVIQPGL